MAKVVIEFDTVAKTCSAQMDGSPVGNLASVEFYRGYDKDEKFHLSMTQVSKNEADDTRTMTHLVASETGMEPAESKAVSDIRRWLGR